MPISQDGINVTLTTGASSATIAYLGASVHSWTEGGTERLFTSSLSSLSGPKAIRGGIPICWPCFGPPPKNVKFEKLAQHGFARTSKWSLDESCSGDDADGRGVKTVFLLKSSTTTRALYEPDFELRYTVRLTLNSLRATLHVTAPPSTTPLPATSLLQFTAALHSYIRLPPGIFPTTTRVGPLGGLHYVDKVNGGSKAIESEKEVVIGGPGGEIDRVYYGAEDVLTMRWEGGGMQVTRSGFPDVVIWNPGVAKAASMADLEDGGKDHFVCLEPTAVGEMITLQPGESWEASAEMKALSSKL